MIRASAEGFDNGKYVEAQLVALLERMSHFDGKLYVEVGGKFLHDGHASRVLPGFDPTCKLKIFKEVNKEYHRRRASAPPRPDESDNEELEIIVCVSARDIINKRVWTGGKTYIDSLFDVLQAYDDAGIKRKPLIAINLCSRDPSQTETEVLASLSSSLTLQGFKSFKRYLMPSYPNNTDLVVSEQGYGADDYITVRPGGLTLVTALGSSSGKLSTCLGQVYHDSVRGITSGYCKYELFPIHNLPLKHPINCAYEAATADIHDRNMVDHWHKEAYGVTAVNYNRDVEAWPILASLINAVVGDGGEGRPANWMATYRSPTDMGVNMAATGIVSDALCCRAAIAEIRRRISEYEDLVPKLSADADCSQTDIDFYNEKVLVVSECRAILCEAEKYVIPDDIWVAPPLTVSSM